jgi:transcriptional regulator with XRE-family HTH domain
MKTQAEVAKFLGITQSQYSRLEILSVPQSFILANWQSFLVVKKTNSWQETFWLNFGVLFK